MAYDFSKLDAGIRESKEWLEKEFSGIRTGRSSPAILDNVRPEVYGTRTPMQQIGSVSIEDARTLRIIPWDKSVTKAIEKAITEADLGISVMSDDQGLRIIFPELTAERRTILAKLAGQKCEEARVTLRGHRTDAIKGLEGAEKEGGMGEDELKRLKEEVQKKIDTANTELDSMLKRKQHEIGA